MPKTQSQKKKIAVLGDGGWGTTLAIHLARKKLPSTVWGAFPRYLARIAEKRENPKFLPGFHIPEPVRFDPDLFRTVSAADIVIIAVPSQFVRAVLRRLRTMRGLSAKTWVSVAKGIENRSLKLVSEVIRAELGPVPLAVLSGPTIAREVALNAPTAVAVASRSHPTARLIRGLLSSEHFTIFETGDVKGVELGGAVKNVIAIAAGIVDGLGLGSNTKAVLMARGLAEIARLGTRMGARRETFMGLSGLGDLATTCFSVHSRNYSCGFRLGQGESIKKIAGGTEMIIEGVDTARSAAALARRHRVSMPITEAVNRILFRGSNPRSAIEALMHKGLVRETD